MKGKKMTIINSSDLLIDPDWIRAITKRASLSEETAQILTESRIKMGFTQKELAEEIGTTQSVIARAESGRLSLNMSFIGRIAKAYETHAHIVFESMPEIVPFAMKYSALLKSCNSVSSSQITTQSSFSSDKNALYRYGAAEIDVRQVPCPA